MFIVRTFSRVICSSGKRRRGERGGHRRKDGLELAVAGVRRQEGIQRDLRSEPAALHWPPVAPFSSCLSGSVLPSAEETLNFWKGIADVGLLGEVVPNISSELLELLNSVKQRNEAAAMQETGTEQRVMRFIVRRFKALYSVVAGVKLHILSLTRSA